MAKEEKKKIKRATALKRDLQHAKRKDANKAFKSEVRTSLRNFDESLKTKDKDIILERLNKVYSLMDKGVKRNIFKANKASRTKARSVAKMVRI